MVGRRLATATRWATRCGVVVMTIGVALLGTVGPGAAQDDDGLLQRAVASRTKGADSAQVTVYEIADFQCPYCAQFAATVGPRLDEAYVQTGRIQWVFLNLPLHTHPFAWPAAEAAVCAGGLGDAFWPMHDRLFQEQATWSAERDPMPSFQRYAEEMGVPGDGFRDCMTRDRVAALLLQDITSVVGAQITGTPTFIIIKGRDVVSRVVGLKTFEEWTELLDSALEG